MVIHHSLATRCRGRVANASVAHYIARVMTVPHPWRGQLNVPIQPQPTDTSCGPTCLQAVYGYYGDAVSIAQVIQEIPVVEGGGTLGVLLGTHALQRGYQVTLYTHNLRIVDPSWFYPKRQDLNTKLRLQIRHRSGKRRQAARAYLEFVLRGGDLQYADLTSGLIGGYLAQGIPVLTGLSATFLYRTAREDPDTNKDDDILGEPLGHFVVLNGYRPETQTVSIADPYLANPLGREQAYEVPMERLINAILLGVLTYDGNLLIIQPKAHSTMNGI